MDVFAWVAAELKPRPVTSDALLYSHQDSQSFRSLPVIYQPFDPGRKQHWHDRGAILDFRAAIGGGHLLDFGPGDGWPGLLVAPLAQSVTGVDAARRRVEVCIENAQRLGVTNFHGAQCAAGEPLPFPDASFDGAMAADAIEQSPDPRATIRELYRVLRPGGRLRVVYESLERYRGRQERDLWLWADGPTTHLVLCDRRVDREQAVYYGLRLKATADRVEEAVTGGVSPLSIDDLTVAGLARLVPLLSEAVTCTLAHPGTRTLAAWLYDAGFRTVTPTHWGATFAARLFDQVDPQERPRDLAALDRLLRPLIKVVVQMEAPRYLAPPLTALK